MSEIRPPQRPRETMVERRIRRVADARSVTIALALSFLGLAFLGAVVIWLLDKQDFASFGDAVWWALQTVTTVGYGDVVPKAGTGRVVGGIEMVLGVSFITFLTAGVTSTVIRRSQEAIPTQDVQVIVNGLAEIRRTIAEVDERLASIESKLGT
jgi:voltage-gated potassium channel